MITIIDLASKLSQESSQSVTIEMTSDTAIAVYEETTEELFADLRWELDMNALRVIGEIVQ